jgi:SAM-dependent methyltransferase
MDYGRLYEYRFRDIDQGSREKVWRVIARHIYTQMAEPSCVLDPAAGRGEFIASIPAAERWAVDEVAYPEAALDSDVRTITSRIADVDLPDGHFDGVFVSNFLEHLPTQEAIAEFLCQIRDAMKNGGRIAILGPNYKYAFREYWDCADHYVPLTHIAIAEHLYTAGFEPELIVPRYIPYSFRGILPPSKRLTDLYLKIPLAWRFLGRQFLVIGRR